ncbi:hypothetical protein EIN_136160 [Entamoeba invadens IP1]|uniref:Ras-GEF domain-containing protein n=1 Tax=Entamoeba invadens IP1 TaxID=370355 RepID=A0A0A1TXF6_ENTIV|nr:hypothetical protein EIN_136160 [Entamoeba invadens IP1]ELP85972.1 hypothetical protein EIN_136160 [Entamoeba invadens IP1]|eukprot:XP_004185318.1 hypothetical protein EIN_136160 [Entamoeba invadens IP1]
MFEVFTTQTIKTKPTKKVVSFFIKVSYKLMVYGNFNISCLMYSAITSLMISEKSVSKAFSSCDVKVKRKYYELKELYSITNQSQKYRKQFEEHTQPKMPVIAFLLGDGVHLEEINNHIESSPKMLNTFKLEKVGVLVDSLYNAREIHYVFSVIQHVRCYLLSLIRCFVYFLVKMNFL